MLSKSLVLSALVLPVLLVVGLRAGVSLAAPNCTQSTKNAIQCGINSAGGGNQTPAQSTTQINNTIARIINLLSAVVGIVAVIMIIIGGFRYITSGGTSEKVQSAKNTILYAIIGLIVVALAQVITRFVLNKVTTK